MPTKIIRLVQEILKENVAVHPDKIALICENRRLTYAQIDEMSNWLAIALRQNGIEDGDRVLLYLLNSVELVVSVFAALKAHAIFSVIDYANTFETLRYISADCEASALVTNKQQLEAAGDLLGEIHSLKFAVIAGHDGDNAASKLLSFESIQQNYPPEPPPQRMIDRDMAFLLYTSGSTGKAKGVVVTHRSALS